jgi:hypothetical protein
MGGLTAACGGGGTNAPSSTTTTTTTTPTTSLICCLPPPASPTEKNINPTGGNQFTPNPDLTAPPVYQNPHRRESP